MFSVRNVRVNLGGEMVDCRLGDGKQKFTLCVGKKILRCGDGRKYRRMCDDEA